jgi:beta-glucosidase
MADGRSSVICRPPQSQSCRRIPSGVEFELNSRDISTVDAAGVRRVVPGDVDVWVGGGQPRVRGELTESAGVGTTFHLANAVVVPE